MMKADSQAAVDRKAFCDFQVCKEAGKGRRPGTPETPLRSRGHRGVQLLPADLRSPDKPLQGDYLVSILQLFWVSTRWLSGHNTYWQFILIESRTETARPNPHPEEFTVAAFRGPRAPFSQTSPGEKDGGGGCKNMQILTKKKHLFLWRLYPCFCGTAVFQVKKKKLRNENYSFQNYF